MQVHGCCELRTCCIRGGTASCPRGWASRAVRPPLAPPRLRWTASHACSWVESLTARHRCGSHALVRCMDARSSTWTRCGHAHRSVLVLVCLWRDGRWGSVHGRTSTCGSGPILLPFAPAWHAIVHVAHRPSCKWQKQGRTSTSNLHSSRPFSSPREKKLPLLPLLPGSREETPWCLREGGGTGG